MPRLIEASTWIISWLTSPGTLDNSVRKPIAAATKHSNFALLDLYSEMASFSVVSSMAECCAFLARLRIALSRFLRTLSLFLSSVDISGLDVRRPPLLRLAGGSACVD